MRLMNQFALITGSSGGGLGTEIARLFADEGAAVVVTGRSPDRGKKVADEISDTGGRAHFIAADLTDPEDCRRLVDGAASAMGDLSILVNCATPLMTGEDGATGSVTDEVWDEMFSVNSTAPRRLIQHALPHLVQRGQGSIVNVTSRTAIRGTPNLAAYSASKAALEGLTRSVAMDYGRQGVRCNSVAPGYIVGKDRSTPLPEERIEFFRQMHLTRMPTTRDVAEAVLFLASDAAGAITGVTLPVDGGGSAVRGLTLG